VSLFSKCFSGCERCPNDLEKYFSCCRDLAAGSVSLEWTNVKDWNWETLFCGHSVLRKITCKVNAQTSAKVNL